MVELELEPPVTVLRLGHRKGRDQRVSTHVALVARAFGAREIIFVGDIELKIREKIEDVVKRWGGPFDVKIIESYRSFIKKWKKEGGIVVHLTMYGENIATSDVLQRVREKQRKILVIVGAEKVPREVYELADFNIAIGNQPHSEIAALAVFLDKLYEGRELSKEFYNARIKIIPSRKGKRVVKVGMNGS